MAELIPMTPAESKRFDEAVRQRDAEIRLCESWFMSQEFVGVELVDEALSANEALIKTLRDRIYELECEVGRLREAIGERGPFGGGGEVPYGMMFMGSADIDE